MIVAEQFRAAHTLGAKCDEQRAGVDFEPASRGIGNIRRGLCKPDHPLLTEQQSARFIRGIARGVSADRSERRS